MAGSLLNFFDRFETDAFDRFENKYLALSVFDALSPGAEREGDKTNSAKDTASWWVRLLFPVKNHISRNSYRDDNTTKLPRYGLIYAPVRWLLGERKAEQFDILRQHHIKGTLNFQKSNSHYFRFKHMNGASFALRENFVIGYGPKRGKINFLAFLNPFNWFRTLDNLFINKGLAMIAEQLYQQRLMGEEHIISRWGYGLVGVVLCTIGAALRLPRVITQYVVGATVKPLWNCIKYDMTHKAALKATPWWGWLLAVVLTAVNVVVIGLTLGGAAPVMAHISNEASKLTIGLAESALPAVMVPAQEVVVQPVATALNEAIKLPLPTSYLQWFPDTSAILMSILSAAPSDCVAKPLCNKFFTSSNDVNYKKTMDFSDHNGDSVAEDINNVEADYTLRMFNKMSNT